MHHDNHDLMTPPATWDAGTAAGEEPTAGFDGQIDSHHGFAIEPSHDHQDRWQPEAQEDAPYNQPVDSHPEHQSDSQHGHHAQTTDDHRHDHATPLSETPAVAGADPIATPAGGVADLHSVAITADHGDDPWHLQGDETSCAIAAQRGILESHLGHAVSEEELRDVAVREHWYQPGAGTQGADVGRLLEHFGIPVERTYGCRLTTLFAALQEHRSVLVGVDAEGIQVAPGSDDAGAAAAHDVRPHIVQVVGMSFDDAGQISLHLNDSATPTGHDTAVDARRFLDAWADCGNFAAITGC
jgi:hypothetical protein